MTKKTIQRVRKAFLKMLELRQQVWLAEWQLPLGNHQDADDALLALEDEFDFVPENGGWHVSRRGVVVSGHHDDFCAMR